MAQEIIFSPNSTPEKSMGFKRFESFARCVFDTPKIESDSAKKPSSELNRVQTRVKRA